VKTGPTPFQAGADKKSGNEADVSHRFRELGKAQAEAPAHHFLLGVEIDGVRGVRSVGFEADKRQEIATCDGIDVGIDEFLGAFQIGIVRNAIRDLFF
jgi:hypothetical protein